MQYNRQVFPERNEDRFDSPGLDLRTYTLIEMMKCVVSRDKTITPEKAAEKALEYAKAVLKKMDDYAAWRN